MNDNGRVHQAVANAKKEGREATTLPPIITETKQFTSVDDALASYPLTLATLESKETTIKGQGRGEHLQTYLRFAVDSWVSGPTPSFSKDMPSHVPHDLKDLGANEIVIVIVGAGQTTLDGVTVSSPNRDLSDFVIGKEYLMLVSFPSESKMGGLEFGLGSAWKIAGDSTLVPLRPSSPVAKAFEKTGLKTTAAVSEYSAKSSR
ncbi:MAG TPA: hypothetical protein VH325_02245 [Bryobacteraceae bacterium]|jgi:hypothetical protein|nr:hypothetical protein [Bryobacteraceae bacterium]